MFEIFSIFPQVFIYLQSIKELNTLMKTLVNYSIIFFAILESYLYRKKF